jgi:hypothetical protein
MIAMEAQAAAAINQSIYAPCGSPCGLNCGGQLIAEESIVAKNIK